jgi:hypothetical protein
LEVSNQVHLIEVAKLMGYAHPRPMRRHPLHIKGRLEARNPREEFRSEAYLRREPAFVVANAQAAVVRQLIDSNGAVVMEDVLSALHDGGLSQGVDGEGQEIAFGHANALLKSTAFAQPQPQTPNAVSKKIVTVAVLICESSRGYSKELPASERLEENSKSEVATVEVSASSGRGLRSHGMNLWNDH